MAIDRGMLDQLRHHLLRPVATRVANLVARAVVQLVDDSTKMQLVQLGVLAGETIDRAEHFQPFGLTSVPLAGAEAVVVFPGGDRAHPLVVAVSDRRYRPSGGAPGTVTLHNQTGAVIIIRPSGDIVIRAAASQTVVIQDEDGGEMPLPTLAEFNGHTHAAPGGATGVPAVLATGTQVLRAQ